MDDLELVNSIIEMCRTAPELCPSCKYLETEPLEDIGWDKWCSKLTESVERVWLCTAYEQCDESEVE